MILRKPYAFLIKNFQKINIFLLILTIYAFIKNLDTYKFVKEYLDYKVYNSFIDPISNYTSPLVYLLLAVVLVVVGILIYLFRYKDKPVASYVYVFIVYLFTTGVFISTTVFFNNISGEGFNLASSMVIRDLLFIASIPQYAVFVLLIVRSIGIDLKKFGFSEDKEFIKTTEEDREEVEIAVGFDYDRLIRNIKCRFRYLKYFFLEHKFSVSIITFITTLVIVLGTYNYFFVVNKVYKMRETFQSNNYKFTVNNTYITDKDYAGNVIEKNKYYVIVDIDVENLLNSGRVLDIEKFYLFTNEEYHVPEVRFNTNFVDMGNLYEKESLDEYEKTNYLLVFEVDKPDKNENFVLSYQDVTSNDTLLKKVKIEITDLSKFRTKDTKTINEELTVPLNLDSKREMIIYNYTIGSSFIYTYRECDVYNCFMREGTMTSAGNERILNLKMNFFNDINRSFLEFALKYGKIKYKVEDKWYTHKLIDASPRSYNGNYLYLLVSDKIEKASEIQIYFTVRTYQYFYVLKGN